MDSDYEEEDDILFTEYFFDGSLDSLSRLEQYYAAEFSLQRLVLARDLRDTAEEAGPEATMTRIIPLLEAFVADKEPPVRTAFAQQLVPLAEYLVERGGSEGYKYILNPLLPHAFTLLVDKNCEVSVAALPAVIGLAKLVKDEDLYAHLIAEALKLGADARAEDFRVVAAQLFDQLAPRVGAAASVEFLVPALSRLAEDLSFAVRRSVAASLSSIAATVGPTVTADALVPLYRSLCGDEIWGVRKSALEGLAALSKCTPPATRLGVLLPELDRFLSDASRWVRFSAYQQIAPFVATLPQGQVPREALMIFAEMASQTDPTNGESDLGLACAEGLAGVLEVAGIEAWPLLENAYVALTRANHPPVRRAAAEAIAAISKLVGPDVSQRVLAPLANHLLRDNNQVKAGLINVLPQFLPQTNEQTRSYLTRLLCEVPANTDSWRLREAVARQLVDVVEIVSPQVRGEVITPLCTRLLDDAVATVRTEAIALAVKLMQVVPPHEVGTNVLFVLTKSLPSNQSYNYRQLFAQIAGNLATHLPPETFINEFAAPLAILATDPVPNVRLVVARTIVQVHKANASLLQRPVLDGVLQKLREDVDPDVQHYATKRPSLCRTVSLSLHLSLCSLLAGYPSVY